MSEVSEVNNRETKTLCGTALDPRVWCLRIGLRHAMSLGRIDLAPIKPYLDIMFKQIRTRPKRTVYMLHIKRTRCTAYFNSAAKPQTIRGLGIWREIYIVTFWLGSCSGENGQLQPLRSETTILSGEERTATRLRFGLAKLQGTHATLQQMYGSTIENCPQ